MISPSAEQKLLSMNPNLYDNGKIFNRNVFVINQMESDYIGYLDLSNICLVDWNILGVDIDPITQAHQNKVRLIVNYYVNYSYLRPELISLGKLA